MEILIELRDSGLVAVCNLSGYARLVTDGCRPKGLWTPLDRHTTNDSDETADCTGQHKNDVFISLTSSYYFILSRNNVFKGARPDRFAEQVKHELARFVRFPGLCRAFMSFYNRNKRRKESKQGESSAECVGLGFVSFFSGGGCLRRLEAAHLFYGR